MNFLQIFRIHSRISLIRNVRYGVTRPRNNCTLELLRGGHTRRCAVRCVWVSNTVHPRDVCSEITFILQLLSHGRVGLSYRGAKNNAFAKWTRGIHLRKCTPTHSDITLSSNDVSESVIYNVMHIYSSRFELDWKINSFYPSKIFPIKNFTLLQTNCFLGCFLNHREIEYHDVNCFQDYIAVAILMLIQGWNSN